MSILRVEQVHYQYKSRFQTVYALKGIDASFESGRIYSVVGPSGCGKTTLLSLLAGLDVPTEGHVYYEDQSTDTADRDALRMNHIAVIYQNFNLFQHLTVLENAAYPLYMQKKSTKEANAVAEEKLKSLGLPQTYFKRFPNMISGGEQQRVAIARALASGARLILADEPTGNLDEENSANIFEILKDLAHQQGYCVIIVTHDLDMAEKTDEILRLKNGVLV